MNILKLVFANMRKRKGASITFLSMVMLAALMLSISLSLMIGGADFYDKKVDELNAPHFVGYYVKESYEINKDKFNTFVNSYENKTDVSVNNALCAIGTWKYNSQSNTGTVFVMNESEVNGNSFYRPDILDKQAAMTSDGIILPVSFKANGLKSGGKITLELNGKNYPFTVYGFYEDVLTGASTMACNIVYIQDGLYGNLAADENYTSYVNLIIRFTKTDIATKFESAFAKEMRLSRNEEFTFTFDFIKPSATMFVNMMSVILIAFSLIILLIAFIVMGFSVSNSIAEDITTIGALKSIGYKNSVLKLSQHLQYLMIAAIGSLLGAIISLLTFGFLGNIIASTSGLLWVNGANIVPIILTVALICILTAIIALIATRKYKKITPINALRQGESNHSFKKNIMPLEKYKMPLNLHFGIKRFFTSLKNNITLCVIVTLLVFVSSVVFTLSYNLNTDRTAMINMVGLEMAELYVQVSPDLDVNEVDANINFDSEVNRTKLSGMINCAADGYETFAESFDNYNGFLVNTVIKGSNPAYKNEVTLGAVTSKAIGKGVGDTVNIEINGKILSYVVAGITQDISYGGEGLRMMHNAVLEHDETFSFDTIYVYLNNNVNTKAYSDHLKALYGNKILLADTDEQMDSILNSLASPFAAITVVMIVVTVLVIAFVLFLIISALIRKQKKELGIMKAIGYKNSHLILQMLISFLPSLFIGTVLGVGLGLILTNPLMSVLFSTMGLLKTYFIIPALPTILIGFGIFGVSVGAAYLISTRLKKISPQKLIAEN